LRPAVAAFQFFVLGNVKRLDLIAADRHHTPLMMHAGLDVRQSAFAVAAGVSPLSSLACQAVVLALRKNLAGEVTGGSTKHKQQ
jgi:hypothetical protein